MKTLFNPSFSLTGSAALALAAIPFVLAPVRAEDPQGVMGINLKDVIKPNLGIQGQTQGAGTPNEAGITGFYPLHISTNGVLFIDALANVNFSDFTSSGDPQAFSSSISNTTVKGGTVSTSTRLGYRWLNNDRSWMFGVNAGYDSRPMATGKADTGISVSNSQTVFFQQVAAGLEAVSNTWGANLYALVPIGTTNQQLNSVYQGGALQTYGLDVGYSITPDFRASLGYYYQNGDLNTADGSGVLGRLAYNVTNDLTAGINLSYDNAFDTRASIDLKYRYNFNNKTATKEQKKKWNTPVIQALTDSVKHRDVRVHDKQTAGSGSSCQVNSQSCQDK